MPQMSATPQRDVSGQMEALGLWGGRAKLVEEGRFNVIL